MILGASKRTRRTKQVASWGLAGTLDDYCQQVLRRLDWPGRDSQSALRTLGITSCRTGEGVSTFAAHLAAAAAARQDGRVVFVDANLTAPVAAKTFAVADAPGLVECVNGEEEVLDALQPTAMDNLSVLAAGKVQGSPARTYDGEYLLDVVAGLAGHAALAVFDLPPVRQASCANRLTAALDGVLLVVEAEAVTWDAAAKVREILARAGVRILGAVLNKRRAS